EISTNKGTARRVRDVLESESLDTVFQPIFDLVTRRVVGAEALARFTTQPMTTPDVWFADADRVGHGLELELLAIRTALTRFARVLSSLYLALNVSPSTLASPQLMATLLAGGIAPARLVLEVTEHT